MNKVIFISGSTQGVGKEIALHFARLNDFVIINGCNNKTNFDQTLEQLKQINKNCSGYFCDLSQYDNAKQTIDDIVKKYGKIDVLINNLAIASYNTFDREPYDTIKKVVDTNIYGYINPTHSVVPYMLKEHLGVIINMSSVFGEFGASCEVAYSLSKGAINTFTKALAKELAPNGILVNGIELGFCDTKMNDNLSVCDKEDIASDIPLSRFCEPKEVASLCEFLVYKNSYIVGENIKLDGGWF